MYYKIALILEISRLHIDASHVGVCTGYPYTGSGVETPCAALPGRWGPGTPATHRYSLPHG